MMDPNQHEQGPDAPLVSLPLTIKDSSLALAVPLDLLEFHRLRAIAVKLPWSSLLLTIGSLIVWHQLALRTRLSWLEMAWPVVLVVGVVLCVLQMNRRVDRLTRDGIERRAGLLGRKVTLIPYGEIDSIEIEYPRFGRWAEVGDLVVKADSEHLFAAVKQPEEIAAAVLRLRRDARSDTRRSPQ